MFDSAWSAVRALEKPMVGWQALRNLKVLLASASSNDQMAKEAHAIRSLAHTCTDEVIAATLNRNNLLTAHGNRWTRELIASLRSKHKIPRDTPV